MRRLFKIIFYLVVLLALVVGGAVAAFLFTPSDTIARMVEDSVEDSTGRKLTIEGEIERSVFPVFGVKASKVTFANADWATMGPLLTADSAEIGVRTLPLLTGALEIEKIAVARPEIQVEIAEDGRRSWELERVDVDTGAGADLERAAGGDHGGGGGEVNVLVESISITEGSLTILDRSAGGPPIEVVDITLDGSFASLEDDFVMTGSAVAQGRPAKLDVKLASPAALSRGERAKLAAMFEADGVNAGVDGDLRAPTDGSTPEAKGTLTLALDGDKQRTAWLRALLPAELAPLGAVEIDGAFDAAADGLDVGLDGRFDFRDRPTTLKASARAGDGWAGGAQPVLLDMALANGLMDATFKGTVQQASPETAPEIEGDYRLKISDAQALMAWSGAPAPAPEDPASKLESVDVAGGVRMTADQLATALKGDLGFNGKSVIVDAGARGGADWDQGGPIETNLSASAPRLFSAAWKGVVAEDGAAVDGDAQFSSSALRAFFDWLGLGPIDAPAGTFESVSFKSDVKVTPESGALENLDVRLDDSTVAGVMSYDLSGERPAVKATLRSGPLDIRPFTRAASGGAAGGGGSGGGGAAAPASRGWSKEPLDLGALQLVDAELDVLTDGLTTNVARLNRTHALVSLNNGLLVATIKEMALYGGAAVGKATIDGSGSTPAMALDFDVSGVQLRPMLNDAAQMDWLEGTGAVKANIAGSGVSEDALMRSLAGAASIDFRNGAIIGYNLAAIVRNITTLGQDSGGEQKTDFAEMTASFQIANGVARNDDFFMAGPLVRLTGKGTIDIGDQTLNYRAEPKAVATLQGQGGDKGLSGIAFPLLITGHWSDPQIVPDLAGGALESVEGLLADPEGAGAFLKELGGGEGGLGDVVKGLTGDGEGGGGLGDALKGLTGGGEAEGSGGGGGLGDALKGLTGGGDDKKKNPLGGLFGN